MAGNYPDPPGSRIAYDSDGTLLFTLDSTLSNATPLANSANVALNDDSSTGTVGVANGQYILFLFPQPMDLTHWATWFDRPGEWSEPVVSTNTTNGMDGTWTAISFPTSSSSKATLRSNILAITANNVVALRFRHVDNWGPAIFVVHLFGKPSNLSNRLELWHPSLDQPLSDTPAFFDYGNVMRNSAPITKSFRIKNLSTTLSANTITVGCEALTDATPTFVSQTQFSYDGSSYANTATISTLAPNTVSDVASVKLTTTASTSLGLWSQRYYAEASDWS